MTNIAVFIWTALAAFILQTSLPVAHEHHGLPFAVATFVMFFIGQFLHAWLRAQAAVRSKLNGLNDYHMYVSFYAPTLSIRFFVAALGLIAYANYGPEITAFFVKTYPALSGWAGGHPVPLNPLTAGVYGLCADALLDGGVNLLSRRYPGLQKELPPAQPPMPPQGNAANPGEAK